MICGFELSLLISSLPCFSLFSLEQLEQLDMSYNKIKFIPNEISQLE